MSDINKVIGKNLLLLRKNKKLTQMELAEHFNYSDKSVSKWEKGESLPGIEVLYELAKFYNVTLDALTKEGSIVRNTKPEKQKKEKMFPAHLIISLIAVSAVWLCATGLYVSLKISLEKNLYMFFMWAVPISCILLVIFNSIWGKAYMLFIILTALLWSLLASIYLQFLQFNMWPVFILGAPIQIAIILCAALIKPRKKPKKIKVKYEQEDEILEDVASTSLVNEVELKPAEKTSVTQTQIQTPTAYPEVKSTKTTNNAKKPKKASKNVPILTEEERSNGGQIKVSLPQIRKIDNNKTTK